MQPCRTCSKFVKWTKLVEAPLILMGYGASCNITFLSGVDPVVFMDQEQIAAVRRTQLLFFILMWLHVLVPVWGVGLRPLACRDCGFESRRGHGWMDGWMDGCCECCVLSGRVLCDELITRPEESYLLWCVVVCDLENSIMRRPWPTGGCRAKNKQTCFGRFRPSSGS